LNLSLLELTLEALNTQKNSLAAISILKSICHHPTLLHADLSCVRDEKVAEIIRQISTTSTVSELIKQSGKLQLLVKLLRNLKQEV
jgi:SNF2 family DNA or RNA helicase